MTDRQSQVSQTGKFVQWVAELAKFGAVGAVSFVVDIGLFNLLVHSPWAPFEAKPVTGKIISVVIATIVSWIGNRYWTFRGQQAHSTVKEFILFAIVNGGGVLISSGSLWISRYVLGYDSQLADNISANVIGVGLGTIFRYVCYRFFVFDGSAAAQEIRSEDDPELDAAIDAVERASE